jgi:hypothetical protein
MPVSDYSFMLRSASAGDITSGANGTGVLVGVAPVQGMKLFVHAAGISGTSPTLDVHLESCDDDSSYLDVVNGVMPQIDAAGYFEVGPIRWTGLYLRAVWAIGSSDTPTFEDVSIGLTPGSIPITGSVP